MPIEPQSWSLDEMIGAPLGRAALLVTPAVAERARSLPFKAAMDIASLPGDLETLIVIGGGTLIDEAKYWQFSQAPELRLIAIPSIWGSGAEVSPVSVLNRNGRKEFHIDDSLVPDVRCLWPDLATDIPPALARQACGDAWSHALEGFLSPLAKRELQEELASVIREMTELPLSNDPRWFEPSARACAGQAQSSVGLVHGIAHTLEGRLRVEFPQSGWGHAKLCSVFLWPVMEFNRARSDKWEKLALAHALDSEAIFGRLRLLHVTSAYDQALDLLDRHWMEILKDVCTRTNSALVRASNKSWFSDREFL